MIDQKAEYIGVHNPYWRATSHPSLSSWSISVFSFSSFIHTNRIVLIPWCPLLPMVHHLTSSRNFHRWPLTRWFLPWSSPVHILPLWKFVLEVGYFHILNCDYVSMNNFRSADFWGLYMPDLNHTLHYWYNLGTPCSTHDQYLQFIKQLFTICFFPVKFRK